MLRLALSLIAFTLLTACNGDGPRKATTDLGALATAAGERGSMAEYLYNTITHLAGHGIHDSYLWEMQELVARRIAEGPPHPSDQLLAEAAEAARG